MVWITRLRCWRPGAYARDGLRIFGWFALRTAAQAAMVLLLAHWLGAESYGTFVAALAVASFFTPLAGLGLGSVLLVRVARDPAQLPALQQRVRRLWVVSAGVFTMIACAAMVWSLPRVTPLWALGALAAAEVAAASRVEIEARVAQALCQTHRFGAIQAGLPLARLLTCAPATMLAPATPSAWMFAYALATWLYVIALESLVPIEPRSETVHPPSSGHPGSPLVREGLPFAGGALALRLQVEFNKPVLAQIAYAEAGALNVAQRIIDLVALPLAALQEALWPRVLGAAQPSQRLWRTGTLLVLLALVGGLFIAFISPFVPWLLGADYGQATQALVWLAGLPALQVLRNLGNMAILAQQRHHRLLHAHAAAAASGVVLTFLLVPRLGIAGAIWAMYGSESVAAVVAWSSAAQAKLGKRKVG